jgi:serine acetyltransferase
MVIGQAIVIGQTTVIGQTKLIRQATVIRQAMAARLEPLDSSGMIVASACNRRAMPSYCF